MEFVNSGYFGLESTVIDTTSYIILEEFYAKNGYPSNKTVKTVVGEQKTNEEYEKMVNSRLVNYGFIREIYQSTENIKNIYNYGDTLYEIIKTPHKLEIYKTSLGYFYNSRKKLFYSIEIIKTN